MLEERRVWLGIGLVKWRLGSVSVNWYRRSRSASPLRVKIPANTGQAGCSIASDPCIKLSGARRECGKLCDLSITRQEVEGQNACSGKDVQTVLLETTGPLGIHR